MRTSTFRRTARAAALALLFPAMAAAQTGDVFVVLQTAPDGATPSFSFTHTFGGSAPSPFTLTDGGIRVFNAVAAGQYSITPAAVAGWEIVQSADGYDTGCWDDQLNSTIDLTSGVASINLGAGEFVVCTFVVQEAATVPPEGDPTSSWTPRGLGYWKNSGKCLKSQGQVTGIADEDQRRMLESQLLGGSNVYPVGTITGLTCEEAARLLGKMDLAGANRANDAAYNLAANLLAAKLNKAAGAYVAPCVANDMATAQSLLEDLGFSGMGDYLGPRTTQRDVRTTALRLGGSLGQFNGAALQNPNCL